MFYIEQPQLSPIAHQSGRRRGENNRLGTYVDTPILECCNGGYRGYPVEAINRAIADALKAGELVEVESGYVVESV